MIDIKVERQTASVYFRSEQPETKDKNLIDSVPLLHDEDNRLYIVRNGKKFKVYIDPSSRFYIKKEDSNVISLKPVKKGNTYRVPPSSDDIEFISRDYGLYLLSKYDENVFIELIETISTVHKFNIESWDSNDIFNVGDYKWYARIAPGLRVDVIMKTIEMEKGKIFAKALDSLKKINEDIARRLNEEKEMNDSLQKQIKDSILNKRDDFETLKSISEKNNFCSSALNKKSTNKAQNSQDDEIFSSASEEQDCTEISKIKKTFDEKRISSLLYYGFQNLIFPPFFINELMKIKNSKRTIEILANLNNKKNVMLKKIHGSPSGKDLFEVVEHISVGDSNMGRIYCRKNPLLNCYEIFFHIKKNSNEQNRFIKRCMAYDFFEERDVVFR
mgnify:CR=1 FL=1